MSGHGQIGVARLREQGMGCTADEAREEGLVLEVGVVLLQVLLAGGDHLDGDELVPALLEARDDVADEAALTERRG
jgi:hypothetical protein